MNGWLSNLGYKLLYCDWLNLFLVASIQIALIELGLWLFRRPLSRVASMRYVIRLLSAFNIYYLILRPGLWDLLDVRGWMRFWTGWDVQPLFRLYLPVQIPSQMAEVPSVGGVDWLGACSVVWLAGVLGQWIWEGCRDRKLRRRLALERRDCPAEIRERLDALVRRDERLRDREIRLVWMPGLPSPCVFDLKGPVIALNRIDYSAEELDWILRHELTHIAANHQRLLDGVHFLTQMCWFNPVLRWGERRLRQQVELVNDEEVLGAMQATGRQRVSYARLLVALAEEKQLSGAVLYLSAGARFVRQRAEAILRPHARRWSLLVTMALILLSLHVTLIVAPGQGRVDDPLELLARLGNRYECAVRGLDPLLVDVSSVTIPVGDLWLTLQKEDGVAASYRGVYEGYTAEEDARIEQFRDRWIEAISEAVGSAPEGKSDDSFGMSWLDRSGEREIMAWPVTLSASAQRAMWDEVTSEPVELRMRWSKEWSTGVIDGLTGEVMPDHNAYELVIDLAVAE